MWFRKADWAVHHVITFFFIETVRKIEKGTGQNALAESDPLWVHMVLEMCTPLLSEIKIDFFVFYCIV